MDFKTWFRAEVIADRLYPAEEEAARRTWIAATGLAADICEQKAENAGVFGRSSLREGNQDDD